MMQYLVGGKFPVPCASTTTNNIAVWTCNFTEANGSSALWVWTPSESGTNFVVPAGFTDYRDLTGGTTKVSAGELIVIGVEPLMLEK